MTSKQKNNMFRPYFPAWVFLLLWVVMTCVLMVVAGLYVNTTLRQVNWLTPIVDSLPPMFALLMVTAGQAVLLKLHADITIWRWMLASLAGFILMQGLFYIHSLPGVVAWQGTISSNVIFIVQSLLYLPLGIGQWWILRRNVHHAWLWIPAYSAGMVCSDLIARYIPFEWQQVLQQNIYIYYALTMSGLALVTGELMILLIHRFWRDPVTASEKRVIE